MTYDQDFEKRKRDREIIKSRILGPDFKGRKYQQQIFGITFFFAALFMYWFASAFKLRIGTDIVLNIAVGVGCFIFSVRRTKKKFLNY